MGRNYINIVLFLQYNTAKKLTGGGFISDLRNTGLTGFSRGQLTTANTKKRVSIALVTVMP